MLASETLPPALTGELAARHCKGCSLKDRCQPEALTSPALAAARAHLFEPEA
jgi:CRISPR-associated exonuclease Cas4